MKRCGLDSGAAIIAEDECRHCHQPIYRTKNLPRFWRHEDGMCVCIATWDNTKHGKGVQNTAEPA